ncbi:MAG: type II toxin-antitoxin system RelE/ParE family toxin [Chloroflexi bacterium]|nr:type II toxin-antitoxin system RelE/ParE family toxin [Chloroflexota bacterium]
MATVIWSEHALRDLEVACLFMSRDRPEAAQRLREQAFRTTERLADFPRSGRMVPETNSDDFREIFVQSYRIIYQVTENEVYILTVFHGARRLEPGEL